MDKEEEKRFRRQVYKDIKKHPEIVVALDRYSDISEKATSQVVLDDS